MGIVTRNENEIAAGAKALRQRAEQILKEKQQQTKPMVDGLDEKRLLHELQVHQIELEMQNEELRQANETAEKALKKYTMLYDCAPTGFFTLDEDGTIIDLNFTGAEMLGERRFSLVRSNFKLFVSSYSLVRFNDFLKNVMSGNGKESCEVTLGYNRKILCEVYIEGIAVSDERNCMLSVIDISAFNKPSGSF